MDNTMINNVNNQDVVYSPGSLFINDDTGDIFILFHATDKKCFYAVSLKDGDIWDWGHTTAEKSVDGLRYLGSGLTITVES